MANVSTDIDDNGDDDRLLNQALDDAELLFCADDDYELVGLANALDSDQQQQQQTTTTIPRQYSMTFCIRIARHRQLRIISRKKPYLLASISVILATIAQCFSHYTSSACLAICLTVSSLLIC